MRAASARPCLPVQALALPALTTTARRWAQARSGANFVTGSISDQPFVLGQAEHDVHVLHRLPRRAFHQVVDDADDDDAPGALVDVREDAAVVGAGDVLELRRRLAHLDEGLAGVEVLVQRHDPSLARDRERAGAHVDGLADAALERHQVRDEGELGPWPLPLGAAPKALTPGPT